MGTPATRIGRGIGKLGLSGPSYLQEQVLRKQKSMTRRRVSDGPDRPGARIQPSSLKLTK